MQEAENNTRFEMKHRHSQGNLHIQTRGVLDGDSVGALLGLVQEEYSGSGRVFVDTTALLEVRPAAASLFQGGCAALAVPARHLFFKGEKGFMLAPDGSRVLVVAARKKKGECCGRCAHCHCGKERRQEAVA